MASFGTTFTPITSSSGPVLKEILASYANKLSPTSLTNANLQKLDANVPNVDYDVWLSLASVHEFLVTKGVDSVLRDGPWTIRGVPIFLNKRPPSASLLKEDLSRVLVWVKYHDVSLVAYTSYGLSLIAMKTGNQMMLDLYTNFMCLESFGRSSYARFLIEINACNNFNDNLVMVVPNLEGTGYTKETIRVEYK
ncbi:zinc knuckle CX2CX4HX4C containing protein [Tanacetum coccineum]